MEKNKHDHKATKKLKVCLFAFAMLLPIVMTIPTMLYYSINEHATNTSNQDVEISYKYETNEVENIGDLIIDNIYYIENGDYRLNEIVNFYRDEEDIVFILLQGTIITPNNMEIVGKTNGNTIEVNNEITIARDVDNQYLLIPQIGGTENYIAYIYIEEENTKIFFRDNVVLIPKHKYITNQSNNNETALKECPKEYIPIKNIEIVQTEYDIIGKIDNAINKTYDTRLLSWVKNGIFTETFNNFTNVFNINNNNYLALTLSYWATITCIYVVIDIILEIFIYITHIFNKEK